MFVECGDSVVRKNERIISLIFLTQQIFAHKQKYYVPYVRMYVLASEGHHKVVVPVNVKCKL